MKHLKVFNLTIITLAAATALFVVLNVSVAQAQGQVLPSLNFAQVAPTPVPPAQPAQLAQFDFGDAPPPYPTKFAENGIRHPKTSALSPWLGGKIDYENDAKPTDLYDDGAANPNKIKITTPKGWTSGTVYLNILIDYNNDGDWTDSNEWVIQNQQFNPPGSPTQNTTTAYTISGPSVTGLFSFNNFKNWTRVTLTMSPYQCAASPWSGKLFLDQNCQNTFTAMGETEDYYKKPGLINILVSPLTKIFGKKEIQPPLDLESVINYLVKKFGDKLKEVAGPGPGGPGGAPAPIPFPLDLNPGLPQIIQPLVVDPTKPKSFPEDCSVGLLVKAKDLIISFVIEPALSQTRPSTGRDNEQSGNRRTDQLDELQFVVQTLNSRGLPTASGNAVVNLRELPAVINLNVNNIPPFIPNSSFFVLKFNDIHSGTPTNIQFAFQNGRFVPKALLNSVYPLYSDLETVAAPPNPHREAMAEAIREKFQEVVDAVQESDVTSYPRVVIKPGGVALNALNAALRAAGIPATDASSVATIFSSAEAATAAGGEADDAYYDTGTQDNVPFFIENFYPNLLSQQDMKNLAERLTIIMRDTAVNRFRQSQFASLQNWINEVKNVWRESTESGGGRQLPGSARGPLIDAINQTYSKLKESPQDNPDTPEDESQNPTLENQVNNALRNFAQAANSNANNPDVSATESQRDDLVSLMSEAVDEIKP